MSQNIYKVYGTSQNYPQDENNVEDILLKIYTKETSARKYVNERIQELIKNNEDLEIINQTDNRVELGEDGEILEILYITEEKIDEQ